MVRAQDYIGLTIPPKSKRPGAGQKKRAETAVGESSAPLVELGSPAVLPVLPPTEGRPAVPTLPPSEDSPVVPESLPLVPVDISRAGEETEEAMPPLKRRRLVRIRDLPTDPSGRVKKGIQKSSKGNKGKGKASDKWESTISLDKDASVASIDVALHLTEKVISPTDEKFMEEFNDMEMARRVVRACMRGATMAYDMFRRVERLDIINQSQNKEILEFTERVKTLGGEALEAKEERDLLRGQLSSLEEEKKTWEKAREGERRSWEEERRVLQAQIAAGEEERRNLVTGKNRLVEEFKKEMLEERERGRKFLLDCQAAVEGQLRTEDMLKEVQESVRKERIAAIKRWKRRHLHTECLELACDVTLSTLRKCYEIHFPAGSEGPPFEEYAEPLLPTLGLSLEAMMEMVEGERTVVPDEELDLSSEEEEGDIVLSSPEPGIGFFLPSSKTSVRRSNADPGAGPSHSSADPDVGPSSPQ